MYITIFGKGNFTSPRRIFDLRHRVHREPSAAVGRNQINRTHAEAQRSLSRTEHPLSGLCASARIIPLRIGGLGRVARPNNLRKVQRFESLVARRGKYLTPRRFSALSGRRLTAEKVTTSSQLLGSRSPCLLVWLSLARPMLALSRPIAEGRSRSFRRIRPDIDVGFDCGRDCVPHAAGRGVAAACCMGNGLFRGSITRRQRPGLRSEAKDRERPWGRLEFDEYADGVTFRSSGSSAAADTLGRGPSIHQIPRGFSRS